MIGLWRKSYNCCRQPLVGWWVDFPPHGRGTRAELYKRIVLDVLDAGCKEEMAFLALFVFPLFLLRPGAIRESMFLRAQCRAKMRVWEILSIFEAESFVSVTVLVIVFEVQSSMRAVHTSGLWQISLASAASEHSCSSISSIWFRCCILCSWRDSHPMRKCVLVSGSRQQSKQSGLTSNWLNLALWACRMYDPVISCSFKVHFWMSLIWFDVYLMVGCGLPML